MRVVAATCGLVAALGIAVLLVLVDDPAGSTITG